MRAVSTPSGSSWLLDERPRDEIADDDDEGTTEDARWDEDPMRRTGDDPDEVRHHEPHEGDDARERDAGARQQSRCPR